VNLLVGEQKAALIDTGHQTIKIIEVTQQSTGSRGFLNDVALTSRGAGLRHKHRHGRGLPHVAGS
jgi:hypothetical protein